MIRRPKTSTVNRAASFHSLVIACAWLLLFMCSRARADTPPGIDFAIAPQALSSALVEFSQQANVQVVGATKVIGTLRTAGVTGHFTIAQALERLLQGTDLAARWTGTHTVTIAPSPKTTEGTTKNFDIPAGKLEQGLKDFRVQSGLVVTASTALIAGKRGNGVRGTLAATEALRRLLKGSGLTFVVSSDGGLAIQANSGEGPSQDKADAADVLVESQQQKEKPYSGMNVDIPRTINDVQPYYIFDSETIQQSGALNLEDFLKQRLTMDTSAQTSSQQFVGNSPASGSPKSLGTTSAINLRGLGSNETLILVDGRRMAGVSITAGGAGNQPDINGIPLTAIDRIEVLPSSASGIYGGSALGGVINIILKRNYNGGEVRLTDDNTFKGSAPVRTADGTLGFSLEDGRTQVMITGHYSDQKPLVEKDRTNVIQRGIQTILHNNPNYFYSATSYPPYGATTNIRCLDANFSLANCVLKNGTSLNSPFTHLSPGANSTTNLNAQLIANAGSYNLNQPAGTGSYGLQQELGSSATVKSALLTVRRQMTSWLDAFAEFSYMSNTGQSVTNPFASGTVFPVTSGNPASPIQNPWLLVSFPSDVKDRVIASSSLETITTGLTAHLPHGWTGEMDYTWSKSVLDTSEEYANNEGSAFENGPLNPFVDTIANPLNLQPYLFPDVYNTSATLNDVAVRASGPTFDLPWGSPTLTVGLEHRKEGYPASTETLVAGTNATTDGFVVNFAQAQSTNSVYAEANIPLITASNAVPGARSLELQIADRLERYSVDAGTASEFIFGNFHRYTPSLDDAGQIPVPRYIASYGDNTRTFGLKYKPIDDVTLRVSEATAFLPPTYAQLLRNPHVNVGGDTILDPKTATMYTVNTISGGNPNLKPQNSKGWDAGIIFEPTEDFLKGLRIDLEFYQIEQFGYIIALSGNQILSIPSLASRITRDPTTALITQIDESLLNATKFKTEGWDLTLDYRKPTPLGTFDLYAAATVIEHDQRQFAFGTPLGEYVGFPGAGGEAKTKANATLTWAKNGWTAGWTVKWFGRYWVNQGPRDPSFVDPSMTNVLAQGSLSIPSQTFHQVFAGYSYGKEAGSLLSNLTVQLGIKDLFNTAPRFDVDFAPYFYSPYGDIRMREYWLTLRKGW